MPLHQTQRVTLTAGVATAVFPPRTCNMCEIGNATSDDLQVLHDPNDSGNYFVIAAGFGKEYTLPHPMFGLRYDQIAFYLKSLSGGTAVLIWK